MRASSRDVSWQAMSQPVDREYDTTFQYSLQFYAFLSCNHPPHIDSVGYERTLRLPCLCLNTANVGIESTDI